MEQIFALFRQLAKEHFYGSVTLKFESGQVVILKKEETIKPHNYRDNRGEALEQPRI